MKWQSASSVGLLKAAQTGHMILSSLHNATAHDTLKRLDHLGIAPQQCLAIKPLIIAQRLLRKCCQHCHGHAADCIHCEDGYHGRFALFETLLLSDTEQFIPFQEGIDRALSQQITDPNEIHRQFGISPPC